MKYFKVSFLCLTFQALAHFVRELYYSTFNLSLHGEYFDKYFVDIAQIAQDPHCVLHSVFEVFKVFIWIKVSHFGLLYLYPPQSYWHQLMWCDYFKLFNCDSVANLEVAMLTMFLPYTYLVFYKRLYHNPLNRHFEQIVRYEHKHFIFHSKVNIRQWLIAITAYYHSANLITCKFCCLILFGLISSFVYSLEHDLLHHFLLLGNQ